ncbi:MAG TPA: hypothetical protein VJ813_18515 [Vicinamibacterales bacterium]|nr:hypothetical protein [Vicinamibacterales bacterium]
MRRSLIAGALALPLIAVLGSPLAAEVKTREKTQIKFEGMLGRVVGMFGGKAAKEGIVSTTAVKGNRKATLNDNTGQIIDLGEEKLYEIDFKKKQYQVTTFEEMRRRMKEAQEKAKEDVARAEGQKEEAKPEEPRKEWEVDFEAKETGQRRQIAGHDARQVIMTTTVREKGKALEDGGGFVMTADSWLGPEIASLKELSDFDLRYYKQLYGADALGLAAEQVAMVMAMYPMFQQASERLKQEGDKLKGTPLATTTTFEAVKSKAQMAEAANQSNSGGGGLGGMLARKMIKKGETTQRGTIFTAQHEFQEVSAAVAGTDLDIPAGFKEKK